MANFNVGHIIFDPFVSWPNPNPKVVNVIINKGNKGNKSDEQGSEIIDVIIIRKQCHSSFLLVQTCLI